MTNVKQHLLWLTGLSAGLQCVAFTGIATGTVAVSACSVAASTGLTLISILLLVVKVFRPIDDMTKDLSLLLNGDFIALATRADTMKRNGKFPDALRSSILSAAQSIAAYHERVQQQERQLSVKSVQFTHQLMTSIEVKRRADMSANLHQMFFESFLRELHTPLAGVTGSFALLEENAFELLNKIEHMTFANQQSRSDLLHQSLNLIKCVDLTKLSFTQLEGLTNTLLISSEFAGDPIRDNHCVDMDLGEFLEGIIRFPAETAKRKGIHFSATVDGVGTRKVRADWVSVGQALSYFLNNAISQTEKGDVSLKCTSTVDDATFCLAMYVADSGSGIDHHDEEKVRHIISQNSADQDTKIDDHGDELAFAVRAMRSIGGNVELLWTGLGKGSCFKLTCSFPLIRATDESARSAEDSSFAKSSSVLYVSNSQTNSFVLAERARPHNIVVRSATSHKSAKHLLKASNFDVVIIDSQTPGGSPEGLITEILSYTNRYTPSKRVAIYVLAERRHYDKLSTLFNKQINAIFAKPLADSHLNQIFAMLSSERSPN